MAMLCHLDKNGYTLTTRANEDLLYSFMLKVASHTVLPKNKKHKMHDLSDAEIREMAAWIRRRSRRIEKAEKSLSYNELENLLRTHHIYFENHWNNTVDLIRYKYREKRTGILKRKTIKESERVANIPHFPGRSVGKKLVKSIRKQAGLSHADGVDSAMFYGTETLPDDFIQKYKGTLRRLAKT